MLRLLIGFKLEHKLLPCHICLKEFYFQSSVFSIAYVNLLPAFLWNFIAKIKHAIY